MKLPLISAILLMATFLNLSAYLFLNHQKINSNVLGASTENVSYKDRVASEIDYWSGIIEKNSSYIDGYLKLATLYKQQENMSESEHYLELARTLDPNSDKVSKVEKLIKEN